MTQTELPETRLRPQLRHFASKLRRSEFLWPVVIFVGFQVVFLGLVLLGGVPGTLLVHGPGPLTTAFFLLSVNVLLIWNTHLFQRSAFQSLGTAHKHKALNEVKRVEIRKAMMLFQDCMTTSMLLSAVAATVVCFAVFGFNYVNWAVSVQICKVATVGVFFFFLLGDFSYWTVATTLAQSGVDSSVVSMAEATNIRDTVSRYLLAVDAPGFVGAVLLVAFSSLMKPSGVDGLYWEGFTAGAIALHVAFSQFALFFLSVLE